MISSNNIHKVIQGLNTAAMSLLFVCVLLFFGYNSNAQFTIGNNASNLGSGCYRITPASTNKKGYVFQQTAIDLNDTIDLKFRINLGSTNSGGEGIMFVLRDSLFAPYIGNTGASLGFDATSMDTATLGIEIDTKQDATGFGAGDLAQDHVAIVVNGSNDHTSANNLAGPIQARPNSGNIEDGNDHTFDIKWNPSTQTLRVFIDCSLRLSYTGDIINTIFNGDNLVHWGFIGTTGGDINLQTFCLGTDMNTLIDPLPESVSICKGDTTDLDAGDSDVNYLWTPSLGLSATNIENPRAYPTATTTYSVRQTYQCDTIIDEIEVVVIPPNFSTSGIVVDAQCKDDCDGTVDLTVNGGTGNYAYEWSNTEMTQDINSLCDGMYIVTVQDTSLSSPNYLCYFIDTFFIDEPTLLNATIINETKTKCPYPLSNNCDAEANGVPSGGTVPYSFNWTSGATVQIAQNLCAGWNFVTITDAQGCTAIDSVDIGIPDSIITIGFGDTTICINSVAAIVAASSGGTPPFSYIWHEGSLSGPVASIASADAVTPVVTTTYFVESFDGNGCQGDTSKVKVNVRPRLEVDFSHVDTICPYDTIDITAIGVGGDSLYSFAWETGNFGPIITVTPDLTRYYVVTLTDFCGTPYAIDSIKVQVGGYDPIRASIEVQDDSICAGKSIYMIASGKGGFHGPDEFVFTWDHNQSHDNIQFVQPTETTSYPVRIEDLCLSDYGYDTVTIYVGKEVEPKVEFDPPLACKESDVLISLEDYNYRYDYNWIIDTFDNYLDYNYDSLIYRFSSVGCFDFIMQITTDFGCQSEKNYECPIRILENPVASFGYYPVNPSNVEPMVDFTSTTKAGFKLDWLIDDELVNQDSTFRYEFYERETPYDATLVVTSDEGCKDSTTAQLQYFEETVIYYPNSFTPNEDGQNDEFFIITEGVQINDFNLEIYDRTGYQVFRTTRQSQGWNGKTPDKQFVPIGTYYMILRYRDRSNIERVIHDEIHIAKSGKKVGL